MFHGPVRETATAACGEQKAHEAMRLGQIRAHRVGASLVAQSLSLALSFADRFLLVGILLRAWGPQIYSDWVVLIASAGLLSLGEFGLGIYFGNVWQRANAVGDSVTFRRMVQVSIYCYCLLVCLLAAIVVSLAIICDLRQLLSIGSISGSDTIVIILLLSAVSISQILRGSISQIYRGRGEFARGIIVSSAPLAASLPCSIIAGLIGVMPAGLAVVYFVCELLGGVAVIVRDISRRYRDLRLVPARPTPTELGDLINHTKWYAVQQGVPIAWLQTPVLVLGSFGVAGNALVSFVILRTLVNATRQLAVMLALAAGVEIVPTFHQGNRADVAEQLSAVATTLAALVGALTAGLTLWGEDFVVLWSGRHDLFDVWTFYWLVAAAIIATPGLPFGMLFMLGNRPKPAALANLMQLGIGLLASTAIAGRFGTAGAAAGLALGEAVASGILLPFFAQRNFYVDYRQYAGAYIRTLLVSLLISGTAGGVVLFLIGSQTRIAFVVSALCWALAGIVPAIYLSLPSPQRNHLKEAVVMAKARLLKASRL